MYKVTYFGFGQGQIIVYCGNQHLSKAVKLANANFPFCQFEGIEGEKTVVVEMQANTLPVPHLVDDDDDVMELFYAEIQQVENNPDMDVDNYMYLLGGNPLSVKVIGKDNRFLAIPV